MTIPTPTVPELDAARAARWREGIESEARRRRRGRTRLATVSASAVLAAGSAAVAVVLASPGVSYAFGGWTAAPTAKTPSETSAATDPCTSAPSTLADVGPISASVVDTRGPFTLGYYVAHSSSTDAALTCVTGPAFAHPAVAMSRGTATSSSTPGAGQISYQTAIPGSVDGQGYTIVTGAVGVGVTGVTFELSDGSAVVATVGDGLLVAWWPGNATVATTQVATS